MKLYIKGFDVEPKVFRKVVRYTYDKDLFRKAIIIDAFICIIIGEIMNYFSVFNKGLWIPWTTIYFFTTLVFLFIINFFVFREVRYVEVK